MLHFGYGANANRRKFGGQTVEVLQVGEFAKGELSDWNAVNQPRNTLQQLHIGNRIRAMGVSNGAAKERQDCGYGIEEDDPSSGWRPAS